MIKKNFAALFVFAFLSVGVTLSLHAQQSNDNLFAAELRPFDFTNKFYAINGILADSLTDRRNGADGQSVFDASTDPNHTDVRIIATRSAYGADGTTLFWNYYAAASRKSFAENSNGDGALRLAYAYPVYMFPSVTTKNSDRQAAMIPVDQIYFEKNLTGVGAVMLVEYTDAINTKRGQLIAESVAARNGVSLDGTPIIASMKDLELLQNEKLVTVRQPELSDGCPTFAIARVMQYADRGSITPDAFLDFVKKLDGAPIDDEAHIVKKFECLKAGEKCF